MDERFVDTVVTLHRELKWREILELNEHSDNETAKNLLWVWPSVDNLKFIERKIIENGLKGVISIGCGCGLFEWIFQEFSKLEVIGYEINQEWWNSRYSNPLFINLNYPKEENNLDPKYALLFCYFNNGQAFSNYVNSYRGRLLFIIGPGVGRGTVTNPEPFGVKFDDLKWKLEDYQEVKNTKDFIAVYVKDDNR